MKKVYINLYRKQLKRRQYKHGDVSTILDQGCSESFAFNQAQDRFAASDIKQAMSTLSKNKYEIFNTYDKGYQYRETGDHYTIPEGTIKTRIFQTKKGAWQKSCNPPDIEESMERNIKKQITHKVKDIPKLGANDVTSNHQIDQLMLQKPRRRRWDRSIVDDIKLSYRPFKQVLTSP